MLKQVCSVVVAVTVAFAAGGVRAQQSYAPCADTNGDCKTDIVDALYIAQSTVGLRTVTCSGAPTKGPRFIDNGDGTVTDTKTGLMWEKKTTDGSVHDVITTYTWSDSGSAFDGTAKTAFLDKLNNEPTHDPAECFAGYCDWRLPSVGRDGGMAELETILDKTQGRCGGAPAVDIYHGACVYPALGPSAGYPYWSSVTDASTPNNGWYVNFWTGIVFSDQKTDQQGVRAVRGVL